MIMRERLRAVLSRERSSLSPVMYPTRFQHSLDLLGLCVPGYSVSNVPRSRLPWKPMTRAPATHSASSSTWTTFASRLNVNPPRCRSYTSYSAHVHQSITSISNSSSALIYFLFGPIGNLPGSQDTSLLSLFGPDLREIPGFENETCVERDTTQKIYRRIMSLVCARRG